MKNYYMSIIDLSEIRNITTNKETLDAAEAELYDRGILTDKGNVSPANIRRITESNCPQFFEKLKRRLSRRENAFEDIFNTFKMFNEGGEYTSVYLYLAFLYGFIQWRVPLEINLISSNYETLKAFCSELVKKFDEFIRQGDENETE